MTFGFRPYRRIAREALPVNRISHDVRRNLIPILRLSGRLSALFRSVVRMSPLESRKVSWPASQLPGVTFPVSGLYVHVPNQHDRSTRQSNRSRSGELHDKSN